MRSDKYQSKYDETIRQMRDEKMDWTFDDFLEKASATPPMVAHKSKKVALWWLSAAACGVVLIGVLVALKAPKTPTAPVTFAKTQREKPVDRPLVAAISEAIPAKPTSENNERHSHKTHEKAIKALASTSVEAPRDTSTTRYDPSYVTINGQPVANEAEAIACTKQALMALSDNIDMAFEKAKAVEGITIKLPSL